MTAEDQLEISEVLAYQGRAAGATARTCDANVRTIVVSRFRLSFRLRRETGRSSVSSRQAIHRPSARSNLRRRAAVPEPEFVA